MNPPTTRNAIIEDPYGVRDGTFFIIDASKGMFENKTRQEKTLFKYCFKEYIMILKQKLTWNRQDYTGLAFLGTNNCDANTKGIQMVHKLSPVRVEQLKEALMIYDKDLDLYENSTNNAPYPLHDVLWLAIQAFSGAKVTMANRRVIFMTCHDIPPEADSIEKHRIRTKSKNFQHCNIQFHIIGLGEDWNPEPFYKDLEIISGSKSDGEDYKKTVFREVMNEVKKPARSIASIPIRMGEDLKIDVTIRSFSTKTAYLKKCRVSKDTNVPLETRTFYRTGGYDDDDDDDEDEDKPYGYDMVFPSEMKKTVNYGGKTISFTMAEYQTYRNCRKPGLDLIGFKPITCDPMNHVQGAKFVTGSKTSYQNNALAFAALVKKCHDRKLMAICAMTLRRDSPSYLWSLIPYLEKGGFYLCKIPFKENVRNVEQHLKKYVFNKTDHKPPTNPASVNAAKKIITSMIIHYNGNQFPNPKLAIQQQSIEILALNLEERNPPLDKTLPDTNMIETIVGPVKQFMNTLAMEQNNDDDDVVIISGPPIKKPKVVPIMEDGHVQRVMERVKLGTAHSLTIIELRNFLKTVGLKGPGNKAQVLERVNEFCRRNSENN